MELLAPAGKYEAFIAAIENGADAVYLGGKDFSARQSADNFKLDEIKRAVEYARVRDKKIYVTVNTLVDDEELEQMLDYCWDLYLAGIDALIVQDLGAIHVLQKLIPDMNIHASTQMTIHNAEGALFLQEKGIKRVVLAREMEMEEIKSIHKQAQSIEIEVFVHGALCYSYSGQCLFSSMVGGRSGNRGRCAQPCRLPYTLQSGDKLRTVNLKNKGRYLLSPSDLCLIEYLPELYEAGVNSLKIEGRMKRPEYVAIVTRAYREALDIMAEQQVYRPAREVKEKLKKIFNRNFSSGYFIFNRQNFLSSKRPNNRGVCVGRVLDQDQQYCTRIKLSDTVRIGDGLEIWVKRGKGPAFFVTSMKMNGENVSCAERGDTVELQLDTQVFPRDRVFKTHDKSVISEAINSIENAQDKKIRVDAAVELIPGQPMKLVFTDERGNQVVEYSRQDVQYADKHPLTDTDVGEKIARLGNTPFYLGKLTFNSDGDCMLPFSDINEARRRAVQRLLNIALGIKIPDRLADKQFHDRKRIILSQVKQIHQGPPFVAVTVSGAAEAYGALKAGADRVYIDLAGIGQKKSIDSGELIELNNMAQQLGVEFIPTLPRIHKPGELNKWDILKSAGFTAIMAANIGGLQWCISNGIKSRVDYSFNIFNTQTLNFLLQQGVVGGCLSPELNYSRIKNIQHIGKCELIVHGEMILMTSQYCMLNGVLGDDRQECPGYCRKQEYYLQDDKGYRFPIRTDTSCRFYLFNSRTLCMIDDLEKIIGCGAEGIRIEARRDSEYQIAKVVKMYKNAVSSLISGNNIDLSSMRAKMEEEAFSPFNHGHYYRGVL